MKTVIILAGGENERIGQTKALLLLDEKVTIIDFMISNLKKMFNEIIVVTNERDKFFHLSAKIVEDMIPGIGPIGGIHSGLIHSRNTHSFVIACDMPFVNVDLIKYMESTIEENDVIVPKTKNGYEALHAFYSKACILPIETQIKRKNFNVTSFFAEVKTREIKDSELENIDPLKITFFNINAEEDYNKAKTIYKQNIKMR